MNPYRRILVATDFGETSIEAIVQAHKMAEHYGAELFVVHALPSAIKANPLFPQKNLSDVLGLPEKMKKAGDAVEELVSSRTGRSADQFHIVIDDGWPDSVLLATVESIEADLVVVGASNQGEVAKFLLGTVAEKVVRYAPCDVLVTRPSKGEHVLAATDFSDPAIPAVARAVEEANARKAKLTVVHSLGVAAAGITSLSAPFGGDVIVPDQHTIEEAKQAATELLSSCLERHSAEGEAVVGAGMPEKEIVDLAEKLPAQLVVVGSTGRSRLNRVLLGGVAEQVVRTAPCSVLVVRSESLDA